MLEKHFELNEQTMSVVEEIGQHMPGGFYICRDDNQKLLYVNRAVLDIYGCDTLEQFRELTGFSFRGMPHPEDYASVIEIIRNHSVPGAGYDEHVEYRIIRRDGSVRWVDDYGHHTETEAYGGVHYVFISDITEKRERLESDLAVRQAVIEALSESYHTVWLVTDVEAETFSLYRGDTEGATIHAAPIREALGHLTYSQAKDIYVRTTAAPEDRERLLEELSLPHIMQRLAERPQFNVNYLRIMDDGSSRYFRIEFAAMKMPGGRKGVVCGFKDVDDEVRDAQRQEHTIREQELLRLRQSRLITALSSNYRSVYYVDLDRDRGICYQPHPDVGSGYKAGDEFPYLSVFTRYAEDFVTEPYRREFLRFIQPEAIREALKRERVISFRYLISRRGQEAYEMVRFAGVRHPEDPDERVIHAVGACFADVDSETRRTLAESRALSDALAAAEQASLAKGAFLSSMSHEIRTPMNAIIGLNSIALRDPQLAPNTRQQLEQIGSSARHLLKIMNDILDMSRIESGSMVIRSEEFSLSRTLEEVNAMIGGQCRDKGLTYECRRKGRIGDAYIGDDMRLRQVLLNILGNAVKFTPPGGSVTFTVEEAARFDRKATLRFLIRDTGIGISREYLPHLFDAFSQEDSSTTSRFGSTGLGLPIAKSLVDLMNGSIEVQSEKDAGTAFTVTVTLTEAEGEAARQDSAGPAETDLRGRRVLVAEDVAINAEILLMVLDTREVRAELAENGRIAVERFAAAPPGYYDAILMDIRMPEMDGLEAARTIRAMDRPDAAAIPIIAVTANAFDEDVQRSMQAGINAHLSKPVQPEELFRTLEGLIGKA